MKRTLALSSISKPARRHRTGGNRVARQRLVRVAVLRMSVRLLLLCRVVAPILLFLLLD